MVGSGWVRPLGDLVRGWWEQQTPQRNDGLQGQGLGWGLCERQAPGSRGVRQLTAIGRLVTAVHTVVVPVTDPDSGDAALGDGALELVGGTGHLGCGVGERMRTRPFHLPPQFKISLLPLPKPDPQPPVLLQFLGKKGQFIPILVLFVFWICTSLS